MGGISQRGDAKEKIDLWTQGSQFIREWMQKGEHLSAEVPRILWQHLWGFCKPTTTFSSLFFQHSLSFTLELGKLSAPAFLPLHFGTATRTPGRRGGRRPGQRQRSKQLGSGKIKVLHREPLTRRPRLMQWVCSCNITCLGHTKSLQQKRRLPQKQKNKNKTTCKHDYSTCSYN